MSRWIEQFEAHAFQKTWSDLKDSLSESKADDETVITSVKELARLKKVVEFLDGMLNGIDPELVPMSTWDSFNGQAAPCLQQINSYNSNRNIAHINKANEHADNLLTYIRPYMVVEGKVAKALQSSIKKYAKTIDEHAQSFQEKAASLVSEIVDYKNKSEGTFSSIDSVKQLADEYSIELFGAEEVAGIQDKVRELVAELDEKYGKITEYYNEVLVGDENKISTKQEISQAGELIFDERDKIKELLGAVTGEVSELEKFHTKIFGKQDEGEERVGGLSRELDDLIQALKDFETEQSNKYNALNDEINSLLPGATSAGLATAYREMKESFNTPIKRASIVFYSSIGLLVFASVLLAIESIGGDSWITFVKLEKWTVVFKGLLYKIPFYAPVLWLAYYATKRRSEYQRLQQEYAHKEALAKSYNSYKKQINELGDPDNEMQKIFIMKAVDAIAYNASETLDGKHGDKMPAQKLIEKLIQELAKNQSVT